MKKIIIFVLVFFTKLGFADWQLCNHVSKLNFITSQNEQLTEVHSFSNMEGSISDNGNVLLKIDLTSVETNNSLRNLRLQDILFETGKYPEAIITTNLDDDFLTKLEINKATEMPVKATLSLHGTQKEIETTLLVTRLKSNCLLVASVEPIIILLKDFQFLDGLEKLRQAAQLDSISNTVSVSLNLFFRNSTVIESFTTNAQ